MWRTALITLTALPAFGMSSAVAHHVGGGRGGGGHRRHSNAAGIHSSSVSGRARSTQSHVEFHNRVFLASLLPTMITRITPAGLRFRSTTCWPSANVRAGYRW
jgi:hypothetical protein